MPISNDGHFFCFIFFGRGGYVFVYSTKVFKYSILHNINYSTNIIFRLYLVVMPFDSYNVILCKISQEVLYTQ
jgi:hypothetical protein